MIDLVILQLQNTLDDSHHKGTTEIVKAIKSVQANIEASNEMKIWDQIMYL